jgi:hypothetical protein
LIAAELLPLDAEVDLIAAGFLHVSLRWTEGSGTDAGSSSECSHEASNRAAKGRFNSMRKERNIKFLHNLS